MLLHWILFLLLSYFYLKYYDVKSRNYNLYANLCIAYLFMMYTLRSYAVGTDTYGYLSSFQTLQYESFTDILNDHRDPVFYIVIKLIKSFSEYNIAVFLFIAISCVIPMGITIKKQSENVFLSLLVMMIFRYSDFPLNAMRNGIAVFIAFYSLNYLISKKYIKFILTLFIASLFHKSLLIYLILLPLSYVNLNKLDKKLVLFFILLFVILLKPIYDHFLIYLFVDQYALYRENSETASKILTVLIVTLFYLIIFINIDLKNEHSRKNQIGFISCTLSLVCSFLALQNPILGRMSLFFGLPFSWMVPNIVQKNKKIIDDKLKKTMIMFIFISIYILGGPAPGVVPYSFFWKPVLNSTHTHEYSRTEFTVDQELPYWP